MGIETNTTETYFMEGLTRGQWLRIHPSIDMENDIKRARELNASPMSQRYYDEYRVVRKITVTTISEDVMCNCGKWYTADGTCACKLTGHCNLLLQSE
jgi:hypothetical protein